MNDLNFQLEGGTKMDNFYILPSNENKMTRVAYLIYEYERLIDEGDVAPSDWKIVAKDVQMNFEDFDGFVLLHGTDTMAYTASALSFMLENLSKCVVLTGALKSIFDLRSDAKSNIKTSILIAGNFQIPEVTIFFRDRLLRGNRSIRRGTDCFYGFDSLNVPPLLIVGANIKRKELYNETKKCKLTLHTRLNHNVSLIRLFPGLPAQMIKACLDYPMEGIVLQSYGKGNVPFSRTDLISAIKDAVDRGALVVTCTQCPTGSVTPENTKEQTLSKLGVIFVGDMTVETALVKLMYVLSKKNWSLDQKKRMMVKSLRGELTQA